MKKILCLIFLLFASNACAGMGGGKFFLASAGGANPTLSTVAVGTNGTSYTFTYSAAVQADTTAHLCNAYSLTWTTAGAETLSYSSGTGTSTVTCTGTPTVNTGDTVSAGLNYNSAYIVASSGGAALQAISGKSVTNNSTQGGLACTRSTIQQSETGNNGTYTVGQYNSGQWRSSQFTYSGVTGALCSIDLELAKVGTPTGNLSLDIYSNNAGSPGTAVASCGTIDIATGLSTGMAWKTFTCDNTTITNGTSYHAVLHFTSPDDGVNYLQWRYDSSCAVENIMYSLAGSSWAQDSSTECQEFKLYIKE